MSSANPSVQVVGILSGHDWLAIAYAASLALLLSLLLTARARAVQRAEGKPLTPWSIVIYDTLLGGFTGGIGALLTVTKFPNAAGLFLGAAIGAAVGPPLMDWLRKHGPAVTRAYAGKKVKDLSDALSAATKEEEATERGKAE